VVRRTEKREVTELDAAGAPGGLGRGILIGVAMFAAVSLNIWFLGDFKVNGAGSVTGAIGILGFMAAAATTEELLFRGVLFRWLEKLTGTWLALLLTGVLFGAAHLANPEATVWGATAIAVEAGFMLAACYAATRSLWVTIGLHFGWNFALGGLFSATVSGNGSSKGLLDTTLAGPDLITGGAFGPEGSVYTVAAGVILTVVFLVLAARRGNIVAPRRRAAKVSA
jgi:membrane protease YdiL (CAAX protease family)